MKNAGKIIKAFLTLADAKIIYDKAQPNTFLSRPVTAIDVSLIKIIVNKKKKLSLFNYFS